jgi:hypothetical protein
MIILGLAGKKGSGKDTLADFLVQEYDFEKMAAAAPLKQSAAALFGIPAEHFEQTKNDPNATVTMRYEYSDRSFYVKLTHREYLQRYGTEAHRDIPDFGTEVWTDMLNRKFRDPEGRYVVTDSRFTNECLNLQARGGRIVYIDRPAADSEDAHISEAEPDVEMYRIQNDGSLADLYEAGHALMRVIESDEIFARMARVG